MQTITINVSKKGLSPVQLFEAFSGTERKRLPKLLAQRYYDLLQRNIDSNKFGFQLSEQWLAFKRRKGWDKRPFIAEQYYKRAIEILVSEGHLAIGFPKSKIHPRSKRSFAEIAQVLEFGKDNIPARPLWRYTNQEFVDTLGNTIANEIKVIVNSIR